tara:strand:+ start:180 stop:2582 length:2403 start_codon:yes stop_codon:yes gene_type:complete
MSELTETLFETPRTPRTGPSADALLEGLNEPQRAAVVHEGAPLLVVAGAGSGKTRVLTRRIAWTISERKAHPGSILAITFTNKAAAEMKERVEELVGRRARIMWVSTFHSACVRILRKEIGALEREGGTWKSNFSIYDAQDQKRLMTLVVQDLDLDPKRYQPGALLHWVSNHKNELRDAEQVTAEAKNKLEETYAAAYTLYQRRLREANALDFDDLIMTTVHLFEAFPEIKETYRRRFRHVLVDEYQDTNHAQYSLIRELVRAVKPEHVPADTRMRLAPDGGIPAASLTVVGDSDQSIYAFRGADIRNIVEFERDFPDSKVILLEQNYRSTQNILDAANAVISNNFDRKAKNLFTDVGAGDPIVGYTGYSGHDEAQFVADEIATLHSAGMRYSDIAVFYRTNSQTRALEEIFIRSGLPYRVLGGTKFYERAEIKDAMAYLIQVANPADDLALRRIMNTPKRGIGPATEAALQAHADRLEVPLREALRDADQLGLGPKVTAAILTLAATLDEATRIATTPGGGRPGGAPADVLTFLLDKTGYVEALRATRDPQDEARIENVEELVAVTKEFGRNNAEGGLIDFLTEVALVAAADDLDDSSGTVSLMTLHTAKGLEFEAVFLTGVEEGLLPHQMSAGEPGGLSEERRLFYVGITRARKKLHLSLAMSRSTFGETTVAMPSRYLQEIPTGLIEWRQSPGDATSRGGLRPRALNARSPREDRFSYSTSLPPARAKTEWTSPVTNKVRDNGDLALAVGDRIRHADFGEGRVTDVSGTGPKSVAEVQFDSAGRKRLLIKIAPIEKL